MTFEGVGFGNLSLLSDPLRFFDFLLSALVFKGTVRFAGASGPPGSPTETTGAAGEKAESNIETAAVLSMVPDEEAIDQGHLAYRWKRGVPGCSDQSEIHALH